MLFVLLFALAWVPGAWAFQLQPMSQEIEPSGQNAVTVFRLTNPGQAPVAVRIIVRTRDVGADGKEVNEPADHLFQVYPSQVILRGGGQQSVRVRWTGPPDLDRERAFRFVAEQVPVTLDRNAQEQSGVRFVLRYRAALYVTPPSARSDVTFSTDQITETGSSSPEGRTYRISGRIENTGTAHQLLDTSELIFRGNGWEQRLAIAETDGVPKLNVLAGDSMPIEVDVQLPDRPNEVVLRGP